MEQARTREPSPGAYLSGNPGLWAVLIANPLHTLNWASDLEGLEGSLIAFPCLLVWLCCPGTNRRDVHKLWTTGQKVEKAVRSWRCCKQRGEKWCLGLFRLYDTRQGQHPIFLDSTRICLDSTAERKRKDLSEFMTDKLCVTHFFFSFWANQSCRQARNNITYRFSLDDTECMTAIANFQVRTVTQCCMQSKVLSVMSS